MKTLKFQPKYERPVYLFTHTDEDVPTKCRSFYVVLQDLGDTLDTYGCFDSLSEVIKLNRGESLMFGNEPHSQGGLIITKITDHV